MTLKFFKKFVKQFLLQSPGTLNINKSQIFSNYKFLSLKKEDFDSNQINYKPFLNSFGELNKDKIFYVIKRTPGTGLFSTRVSASARAPETHRSYKTCSSASH